MKLTLRVLAISAIFSLAACTGETGPVLTYDGTSESTASSSMVDMTSHLNKTELESFNKGLLRWAEYRMIELTMSGEEKTIQDAYLRVNADLHGKTFKDLKRLSDAYR